MYRPVNKKKARIKRELLKGKRRMDYTSDRPTEQKKQRWRCSGGLSEKEIQAGFINGSLKTRRCKGGKGRVRDVGSSLDLLYFFQWSEGKGQKGTPNKDDHHQAN
jgi:hypothetical protein